MALKLGITVLIHNKDDIQFVTEFPCFLGHPVTSIRDTFKPRKRKRVIEGTLVNQVLRVLL